MAVQFAAAAGYQGGPTLESDGKTFTASLWFKTPATLATQVLMNWHRAGQSTSHGITVTSAGAVSLSGRNAAGTAILASGVLARNLTYKPHRRIPERLYCLHFLQKYPMKPKLYHHCRLRKYT